MMSEVSSGIRRGASASKASAASLVDQGMGTLTSVKSRMTRSMTHDDFVQRAKSVNSLAKRISISFTGNGEGMREDELHAGAMTRVDMIRYLSMVTWSRRGCIESPLPILLWAIFLSIYNIHAHTVQSFDVGAALRSYVEGIEADLSRGVPTERIYSDEIEQKVNCKCSCALNWTEALCRSDSGRSFPFESQVSLAALSRLRVRSGASQEDIDVGPHKVLADVANMDDVWFWVQHGFIPELWKEESRVSPIDLTDYFSEVLSPTNRTSTLVDPTKPKVLLSWNQLISGVRLRQYRVKEDACAVGADVAARYGKTCHSDLPTLEAYGPGKLAYAEGFVPEQSEPGAFDAFLDSDLPPYMASEKLKHRLRDYRWLDSATRKLSAQAMFFNAEAAPPLIGSVEVHFQFEPAGGLKKQVLVRTSTALPYVNELQATLDLAWFVVVSVLALRLIWHTCQRVRKKSFKKDKAMPLFDFFTFIDLATVVGSVAIGLNFLLLSVETSYTADRITKLPPAPTGEEAVDEVLRQYHETWGSVLDQVLSLMNWVDWNRLYLFWYTLLLTLQFLVVFRTNPKLAQLGEVLVAAWADLMHFVLFFLAIFLNFAFAGFMVFGVYLEGWSTGFQCLSTTFQIVMGYVDISDMYNVAPVSTMVWFIGLAGSLIFICMNLLVAIMYDKYRGVKSVMGSAMGLVDQCAYAVKDFWARRPCQAFCRALCCRRRDGFPSHSSMLMHLMGQSGLKSKETIAVQASVLGAIKNRRNMENNAFLVGDTDHAEKVRLGIARARADLESLGVDEDYIDHLLTSGRHFVDSEYDFEERSENQLRDLVMLSEGEMMAMRERLADCNDFAGDYVDELSDSLEKLEYVTHQALADLVQIAEGAQVSTKAQPASASSKAPSSPLDRSKKLGETMGRLRSQKSMGSSMGAADLVATSRSMGDILAGLKDIGAPIRKTVQDPMSRLKTTRTLPAVPEGAEADGGTSQVNTTENFHRSMKKVVPHGRWATSSARNDWRGK